MVLGDAFQVFFSNNVLVTEQYQRYHFKRGLGYWSPPAIIMMGASCKSIFTDHFMIYNTGSFNIKNIN